MTGASLAVAAGFAGPFVGACHFASCVGFRLTRALALPGVRRAA
jgi:hypothetical protein